MKILGGVVVAIGVLALWGYSVWDTETLRYRLTYEVEVAGEIKTGSSIVQVRWEDTQKLPLPNTGVGHEITGEAVVVDLGGGKYLFSLLKGVTYKSNPNELVQQGFGLSGGVYRDLSLIKSVRLLKQAPAKVALDNSQLPLLVTFTDINDPASVKRVDPDDLAASFGAGYRLKGITLEITDEKVTEGVIEGVLGWIHTAESLTPRELQPKYVKDQTVEQKLRLSDFIDWRTMREKRSNRKLK